MPMKKLQALADFLPILEKPNFTGGWIPDSQEIEPRVFIMPDPILSKEADEFLQAAYKHGWVLRNLNWPDWAQTEEAISLLQDEALARATPEQLYRLLTVVIRQDRFVEGALLNAFESGLILRIVRRAADIVKAEDAR
jgi:hypothetical protein